MSEADKIHEPTPRRRQQARAAGRTAHSADLASTALLIGSLGLLAFLGTGLVEFLADTLRGGLSGGNWKLWIDADRGGSNAAVAQWNELVPALGRTVLPVLGGAAALGVAVHLVQTGFLFRTDRIAPDLARISPLGGLRRLFSADHLARAGLGAAKVIVVAGIGLAGLWNRREELAALAALDLPQLSGRLWDVCLSSCLAAGGALAALAVVDYGYQRWKLANELRMTPQELRDELREMEGDPQLKARRRELALRTTSRPDEAASAGRAGG